MALRRAKQDEGEWETPFYQQRGWLLSAGFLLAMLVLAGVAAVVDTGQDDDSSAGATEPSASPRTAEPSDAGAPAGDERPAGCRTDDGDQDEPLKPPTDLAWKNVGSETVPTSPSAGPLKFDGPIWSCYAHTPMGAVMAAHAITQHIPYAGWRELAEKQFAPGPGREAFMEKRAKVKDRPLSAPSNSSEYAGFQVLAYSKEQASIMVLLHFTQDIYFSTSVDMKWMDGDWKLVLRSDGTYAPDPGMVEGTRGFVVWG